MCRRCRGRDRLVVDSGWWWWYLCLLTKALARMGIVRSGSGKSSERVGGGCVYDEEERKGRDGEAKSAFWS